MLVHFMETTQHVAEIIGTNRDHGRETYGRIHRVTAADPVPEAEHICRIDAELPNLLRVRRDGDKMLCDGRVLALQTCQQPLARSMRIGHRLQCCEGLGGHYK